MSVLGKVIGAISGGTEDYISAQLLYDKVIGFRGIVDGVGCSTIVQNVAIALSDLIKTKNICVVDTHILYPSQYQFLVGDTPKEGTKDWFDFDGENLADCRTKTKFHNIYLLSFYNRNITDMLSSKDSAKLVDDTIAKLKYYFDIILVDLSHETTNISMEMAIQCNQIYTIVDPSMNCISNMGKSLNYMATLAVPFGKMNKAILNKNNSNVNAGVKGAIAEVHLDILGVIPNSIEIATYGITGKKIWSTISNNEDVTQFHRVIRAIVDDIFPPTQENKKAFIKTAEEVAADNNDDIFADISRTPDEEEVEVDLSKAEYKAYMKERKLLEKTLKKQGKSADEIKELLTEDFNKRFKEKQGTSESTKNGGTFESTKNGSTPESTKNGSTLESAKNGGTLESTKNGGTIESTEKSTMTDDEGIAENGEVDG